MSASRSGGRRSSRASLRPEPAPYQENGRWYLQGSFGYATGPDGRRRRDRRTFSGDSAEQVRLAYLQARAEHALAESTATDSNDVGTWELGTWLEFWLASEAPKGKRGKPLSTGTLENYRTAVNRVLAHPHAKTPVRDVTPLSLSMMLADWSRESAAKGHSNVPANRTMTCVSSALSTLVAWDVLPANPALAIAPLPEHQPEILRYSPAEVDRIVAAAGTYPKLGAMFCLLAVTGVRLGESLGLRWVDLEPSEGRVQLVVQPDRRGVITELKSRGSRRPVPVPGWLFDLLEVRRKEQDDERALAESEGRPWSNPKGQVFTRPEDGKPWLKRTVQGTHWPRIREAAGLPESAVMKTMRSTVASRLADSGASSFKVQNLLGHSSIKVTERYYTHVDFDRTLLDGIAVTPPGARPESS